MGGLLVNLTAMTRYHKVRFNGLDMLTHIKERARNKTYQIHIDVLIKKYVRVLLKGL